MNIEDDVRNLPQNVKINLLLLSVLIKAEMEDEKNNNTSIEYADTALSNINMRLNLRIKTHNNMNFYIPNT